MTTFPIIRSTPMRTHLDFSRFGRVLLGLVLAVCLTPVGLLRAQTKPADPEAIQDTKRAATATFLDRSRPQEERLARLKALGYPAGRRVAALLALGIDRTQGDAIRWEALRRLPHKSEYLASFLR